MARARYRRVLTTCATVALLTSSGLWGGYPLPVHAAMSTIGVVTESLHAGPYMLTLRVGPLEQMYTPAEVKKKHPKSGEVMLRGTMVMGGMGMNGAMPNHHLEVHVYNRATTAVVANAMVAITVETPAGKVLVHLPIAVMRGVTSGPSDIHYGNNIALKDGKYKVGVQVEHTTGVFMLTVGKAPMSM
jgi:hypothetical protein